MDLSDTHEKQKMPAYVRLLLSFVGSSADGETCLHMGIPLTGLC